MIVEETSTLTAKNQTTVPKAVRNTLGLRPGDQIAYQVENGSVRLIRRSGEEAAVDAFLRFLSDDIKQRPGDILPIKAESLSALDRLIGHIDIDLEADFGSSDR